jgi:hypothetical protein
MSSSTSSRTSKRTATTTTMSWAWFAGATTAACLVSGVSAKAILGIDLGSLYMKVALVQRGAPLEIVTNLHSKRKTEQLILFDAGSRFFGADADSLLARKPTKVPASMSVMLGRDDQHPAVKVCSRRFWMMVGGSSRTFGVYFGPSCCKMSHSVLFLLFMFCCCWSIDAVLYSSRLWKLANHPLLSSRLCDTTQHFIFLFCRS